MIFFKEEGVAATLKDPKSYAYYTIFIFRSQIKGTLFRLSFTHKKTKKNENKKTFFMWLQGVQGGNPILRAKCGVHSGYMRLQSSKCP